MRTNSKHLIVFAKAFPLVEMRADESTYAVGSFTRTGYDLKSTVKENFAEAEVGVKVKFDVLNRNLLEYVGEYGCRVLHLSSDIFEHDKLCIEGDFGIC